MSRSVTYREQAVQDLESIYNFVAEEAGPKRAADFTDRIRAHCDQLALFPKRGPSADHIASGIRLLAFERRVTIAYRVDDIGVRIVRIFYAGRDWTNEEFPA